MSEIMPTGFTESGYDLPGNGDADYALRDSDYEDVVQRIDADTSFASALGRAQADVTDVVEAMESFQEHQSRQGALYLNKRLINLSKRYGVDFSNASNEDDRVASLEASVSDALSAIWQKIIETIYSAYVAIINMFKKIAQSVRGLRGRVQEADRRFTKEGKSLSDMQIGRGLDACINGRLYYSLPAIGYLNGDQLVVGKDSITLLKRTEKTLLQFYKDDSEMASEFERLIAKEDGEEAKTWLEKTSRDLFTLQGENQEIKNSDLIGGYRLAMVSGKVQRTSLARQRTLDKTSLEQRIKEMITPVNFAKLIDVTKEGLREVDKLITDSARTRSASAKKVKGLLMALAADGEVSKKKARREISAWWSKIAFKRTDITTSTLSRALSTSERFISAFVN